MVPRWRPLDDDARFISSLSGYAQYVRTGDVLWLIGGTIILASWPYAYFVVTPVNILLYGSRMPLFEAPYPGLASPACCWHAREAYHARHTYSLLTRAGFSRSRQAPLAASEHRHAVARGGVGTAHGYSPTKWRNIRGRHVFNGNSPCP